MSEPGKAPGAPGGPGGPDDMVLGDKEPVSPEVQPEAPVEVRPPEEQYLEEGGFGWVVVAAVCFVNAHTWGLNSSFGVFLAFYIKNNTFQSSALGYAFIGGLSVSVAFLVSPLATFLGGWDKYGTRLTVFTGGIFVVIAFIGSSFATKLWHIILTQGVAFGIGLGLSFVASAPVPAQWFHKKRSLANGLSTAGSGFGGLIYSLGANAMIEHIGLAWTFRALAVICFVVNGVAAFFIRDRNKAVGSVHIAFNWKLFRRPEFVLFLMWLAFSVVGYLILVFSIVAYCQAIGLSASRASLVGALFNLGQGFGRPTIGLSSDFVGRLNIANLSTLLCGILCLFLWTFGATSFAGCVVFALLGGSVAGVMWPTVSPVCAEVLGLALIPSALSITWLVLVIPATFAEVTGLSLRNPGTFGYRDVQLFTGFIYIGAFIFGWILRAWKVHDLERTRLEKAQREIAAVSAREEGVLPSTTTTTTTATATATATTTELRRHASHSSSVKEKFMSLRGLWAIQRV